MTRSPFARCGWQRVANPIGVWLLGRDIGARIGAFGAACADPSIVAAAMEQSGLGGWVHGDGDATMA